MTLEIAIVLAILVGTIVLMASELWPVEGVALLVVVTLVFARIITPEQALDGFGDASLVMIASVSGSVRFLVAAPCNFSSSAFWESPVSRPSLTTLPPQPSLCRL